MVPFYEGLSQQLSLYVRQLAWLNTAPDAPKGQKQKPPTRIVRMKADGLSIELPDNPAPYLTDWLMEIGPLADKGMGAAPLEWGEIAQWQRLVGVTLTPWEARTLRKLSRAFHDQMHKAKEPTCSAPFVERANNDDAVTEQFKRMFRTMSANKKVQDSKRSAKHRK